MTAKQLTVPKIGVSTFRAQTGRVPAVDERAAFRAICQITGVDCRAGEEAAKSTELLRVLGELARSAGGPPPLPEPPSTADLDEQQGNSDNERVIEIAAMTELKAKVERWKELAREATGRMESWRLVQRLLAHAKGLPDAPAIGVDLLAIEDQRTMLSEPDPLTPIRQSLTNVLREAVISARDDVVAARTDARTELEATDGWSKPEEAERAEILRRSDLVEPPALAIGNGRGSPRCAGSDAAGRMGGQGPGGTGGARGRHARGGPPPRARGSPRAAPASDPEDAERCRELRHQCEDATRLEIADGPIVVS